MRVTWTVTSTQGPGTGRLGMHPDVVEARGAPRLEPNRAPDAAGERRRPPVPAEAARRLADRLEGHGVRTGPGAVLEALGVGVPDGAAEPHLELVAALAQDAGDVQSVPAMLVAHLGEDRAVEENRCDGVDSVEHELMVLGRGEFCAAEVQRRLVRPVDEADPGQQCLVDVEVRIGDETRGEEVEVHHAGHGRLNGSGGDLGRGRPGRDPDGPASVQWSPNHAQRDQISRSEISPPVTVKRCFRSTTPPGKSALEVGVHDVGRLADLLDVGDLGRVGEPGGDAFPPGPDLGATVVVPVLVVDVRVVGEAVEHGVEVTGLGGRVVA